MKIDYSKDPSILRQIHNVWGFKYHFLEKGDRERRAEGETTTISTATTPVTATVTFCPETSEHGETSAVSSSAITANVSVPPPVFAHVPLRKFF